MDLTQTILQLEERLYQAQLASNISMLDELIHENLIFTALDGNLVSKQDDLNAHRSSEFTITQMHPLEQRVIDLGEVAVVNALMDTEAIIHGEVHIAKIRYTRVWKLEDSNWKIVAGHMSMVQTGAAP